MLQAQTCVFCHYDFICIQIGITKKYSMSKVQNTLNETTIESEKYRQRPAFVTPDLICHYLQLYYMRFLSIPSVYLAMQQNQTEETRNSNEDFPRRHFKLYHMHVLYVLFYFFLSSCRWENVFCFKRAENHERIKKQICHLLLPNNYILIMFKNKKETTLKVNSMFVLYVTICSPKK